MHDGRERTPRGTVGGEGIHAGKPDRIERRRLQRVLPDSTPDLVSGVRDAQVEAGIAERTGLLPEQTQRRIRLVELLEHLGTDRVEPELDRAVAAPVTEGRKIDAQVG